jgi:transposase
MSTSLLYHAFAVRGYSYVRTRYPPGGVVFVIDRKTEACRCVACDSANVWRQGVVARKFRTVPIGGKRVELEARIPRLACLDCGAVRQAAIGFAEPRRTYTKLFERYEAVKNWYLRVW